MNVNAPAFAPDNETPEQLAERRKRNAATLRVLADELEAGKLPFVGIAFGRNCEDEQCQERRHFASFMFLDTETSQGFITMRGMAAALSDACTAALQHRAMQRAIARGVAEHEAQEATKQ